MPLVQSFLKFLESGQLLVTRQLPDPTLRRFLNQSSRPLASSNASSASSICRLPVELLQIIFRNVLVDRLWEDPDGMYHDALDIGCTCRHFHQVIQPLIYEHIHLGILVPPRYRARRLFRTLSECHDLQPLCRHLYTSIEFTGRYKHPDDFLFAQNLIFLLPNLRTFKLGGEPDCIGLWPMLREVFLRTPGLEDVALPFANTNGDTLVRIACELELPNLSRIALNGRNAVGQVHQASLAPCRWGTSSLKHVTITSFSFGANYVHKFVQWAAALESFEFFDFGITWNASERATESAELMRGVLERHGRSLSHIHIESFRTMAKNTFLSVMFGQCARLRSVQIDGSDHDWKAAEVVELLLRCPCVTTLIISYQDEWVFEGRFAFDLTPAIAEMIVDIAQNACERRAALRTICVVFLDCSLRGQGYNPSQEEEELYPPGLLQERLHPLGIAIRYLSSQLAKNVYRNLELWRPHSREGSFFLNDHPSGWDSEKEQDWMDDPGEGEMWRGNIFLSRQSGPMDEYIVRQPQSGQE